MIAAAISSTSFRLCPSGGTIGCSLSRSSVIASVVCCTSSSICAFARSSKATARRLADLCSARLSHGEQFAERRDVERRVCRERDRSRLRSQHPRRDLQILRVDPADRHRAVGVSRVRDHLERATCEWMKRVVDDDRRTMGLLNDSGSTRTFTRSRSMGCTHETERARSRSTP